MTVLALKLLLAPLLVVGSSLAGRRWGPRVAGILVVLPIVAGPILLILYLEHGSRFAADAASAATLGIVSLAFFAVVFAYLSKRHGWFVTLLASWLVVLATDLALSRVDVPAGAALALALLALHGASALLRRQSRQSPPLLTTPWWDLPARAAATALLVLLVTGLAASLGPALSRDSGTFPHRVERGLCLCGGAGWSCWSPGAATRNPARPRRLRVVLLPGGGHDQQGGRCGGIWCCDRRRGDRCDLPPRSELKSVFPVQTQPRRAIG